MRKAAYMNGIQNIGGAVSALANPWIGNAIQPGLNYLKQINPQWEHAQNVWSGPPPTAAPKVQTPQTPSLNGSGTNRMPSLTGLGPGGGMEGPENASGAAPSFLPKSAGIGSAIIMGAPTFRGPGANTMMPKPPAPAKLPGMMQGVQAPVSAQSVFNPIGGNSRRAPMSMFSRFTPHNWLAGGGGGGGNGGAASMSPTFAGPAGGGTVGPGSSAGTTGGGDGGAAGQT